MPNLGPIELIVVLIVAVLILGPKRIPAAARSVGEGIRGFRGSLKGGDRKDDQAQPQEPARVEKKSGTGA